MGMSEIGRGQEVRGKRNSYREREVDREKNSENTVNHCQKTTEPQINASWRNVNASEIFCNSLFSGYTEA